MNGVFLSILESERSFLQKVTDANQKQDESLRELNDSAYSSFKPPDLTLNVIPDHATITHDQVEQSLVVATENPKAKKPRKPRHKTGYMIFIKDRFNVSHPNGSASSKESFKIFGQEWRNLSEQEKHEWNEKAKKVSDNIQNETQHTLTDGGSIQKEQETSKGEKSPDPTLPVSTEEKKVERESKKQKKTPKKKVVKINTSLEETKNSEEGAQKGVIASPAVIVKIPETKSTKKKHKKSSKKKKKRKSMD